MLEQFAGAASASLEAESMLKQQTLPAALAAAAGVANDAEASASSSFDIWGATTAPTVLLTTPSAARGLDFVNLTHVYSLNVLGRRQEKEAGGEGGEGGLLGGFMDERAEYAHQAGRLGRLGNRLGAGTVTSIVEPATAAAMCELIAGVAGADADVQTVDPAPLFAADAADASALPEGFLKAVADGEDEDGDGDEEGSAGEAGVGSGEERGGQEMQQQQQQQQAGGGLEKEQREKAIRRLEDLFDLYEAPEAS